MIRAITFDVFGTLLDYTGCDWIGRYPEEVKAVRDGVKPYRPLSTIFAEIGAHIQQLRVRPGVVDALARLKERHAIAALSNADSALTAKLAEMFGLPWSTVIDVEAAKAFKPAPAFYRHGLERLGLDAGEVLHVAAHRFDIDAAKALGFRTAYLAWPGYAKPAPSGAYDYQVESLSALADALEAADASDSR